MGEPESEPEDLDPEAAKVVISLPNRNVAFEQLTPGHPSPHPLVLQSLRQQSPVATVATADVERRRNNNSNNSRRPLKKMDVCCGILISVLCFFFVFALVYTVVSVTRGAMWATPLTVAKPREQTLRVVDARHVNFHLNVTLTGRCHLFDGRWVSPGGGNAGCTMSTPWKTDLVSACFLLDTSKGRMVVVESVEPPKLPNVTAIVERPANCRFGIYRLH